MKDALNNTPEIYTKQAEKPELNQVPDQVFSVLVQTAVRSALSEDSSSTPDKELLRKLLVQVSVPSPYTNHTEGTVTTRSNFKKINYMYTSVVHAWRITVPVVALVLAVSSSAYYYQGNTVSKASVVNKETLKASYTDGLSATNLVTEIDTLINSEIVSELAFVEIDSAEDVAIVTSDSSDVKDFNTAGDIESLQ